MSGISIFLLRIIFLCFPGFICYSLFTQLTGKAAKEKWGYFLSILFYSTLSYFIYYILTSILNSLSDKTDIELKFFESILQKETSISWDEIIYVSIIGFVLAFVLSYCDTYKIINRFARRIRATKRYGDEDVWDFFHNIPNNEWVWVRDHKLGLLYFGWIRLFSDSEKPRELLLQDVDVHDNETGDFLYNVPAMYLSRARSDLTIEIPVEHSQHEEEYNG